MARWVLRCGLSLLGCSVEFTLMNPGDDESGDAYNSVNYSLQSEGNHQL